MTNTPRVSKAAQERATARAQLASGELKPRDTYTAKQIASRCGTDAKTMRKFFRSKYSTVEPVGQGGRYEFDARDFPTIKAQFTKWRAKTQSSSQYGARKIIEAETPPPSPPEESDDLYQEAPSLDDLEGPSDEDLMGSLEDED